MIYGEWAYVRPGLNQPIDFGVNIFYVRKHPKLEFDGRCFWNGTNGSVEIRYWCVTEGEDWERVEKVADVGDYWVVRDYQIIEERTKEVKAKKIDITYSPIGAWTTTSAITFSPNGWENATGRTMSDYIDELVQERFDAFMRRMPNGDEIQRAVIEALHKEDLREALDQLVPHYINSWEICMHPYGMQELRCAGVDGQIHVFNLDALGVG